MGGDWNQPEEEFAEFSYSSKSTIEHFNWRTAIFWQHPKRYDLYMAISTLFSLKI
jgi:hypothetical protein